MKSDCELSVKSLITAAAMRSRLCSRSLYRLPNYTSDDDLRAGELAGARTSARTYVAFFFRVASTRGLTGKCALQNADADAALKLHLLR